MAVMTAASSWNAARLAGNELVSMTAVVAEGGKASRFTEVRLPYPTATPSEIMIAVQHDECPASNSKQLRDIL